MQALASRCPTQHGAAARPGAPAHRLHPGPLPRAAAKTNWKRRKQRQVTCDTRPPGRGHRMMCTRPWRGAAHVASRTLSAAQPPRPLKLWSPPGGPGPQPARSRRWCGPGARWTRARCGRAAAAGLKGGVGGEACLAVQQEAPSAAASMACVAVHAWRCVGPVMLGCPLPALPSSPGPPSQQMPRPCRPRSRAPPAPPSAPRSPGRGMGGGSVGVGRLRCQAERGCFERYEAAHACTPTTRRPPPAQCA